MTDNLERLEREWPQQRPKHVLTQGRVKGYLAAAILMSAVLEILAGVVVLRARSHHIQGWNLDAFTIVVSTLIPWPAAIIGYRRIKHAIILSGGSQDIALALQYHGAILLFCTFIAMTMIFNVTMSLTMSFMSFTPH